MSTFEIGRLLEAMEEHGELPAPGSDDEKMLHTYILCYAMVRSTNGVSTIISDGNSAATILLHNPEREQPKTKCESQ
jgi:hypothetical protein